MKGKVIITEYHNKILVALIKENRLYQASMHSIASEDNLGAIYIGKVKNIVSNINACFVEIENKELCFLPLNDIKFPYLCNRIYDGKIMEGDELIVQVNKAAMKTKQASVTTKITLSNQYFVCSIGNKKMGYSKKISNDRIQQLNSEFQNLNIIDEKQIVNQENIIPSFGIIARSQISEIELNIKLLVQQYNLVYDDFKQIYEVAKYRTSFSCIKEASPSYISSFYDISFQVSDEIVTDLPDIYTNFNTLLETESIISKKGLRLNHADTYSLMNLYSIETRVQEA